jgi:hypothetical protein
VLGKISDRQPRGEHTKAFVEGGQLAQQRLERRLSRLPSWGPGGS